MPADKRLSTPGAAGSAFNLYDVVSMTRLTWDNKYININTNPTYDGFATILRPYFSPTFNDCFFTYSNSRITGLPSGNPVFRLFQPTTLGELYPPSASWHSSVGVPSEYVGAATNHFLWTIVTGVGGAVPLAVVGRGVTLNSFVGVRTAVRYLFTIPNWAVKLPKMNFGIKCRFRSYGFDNYPVDLSRGVFAIKIPPTLNLFYNQFLRTTIYTTNPANPIWVVFTPNSVIVHRATDLVGTTVPTPTYFGMNGLDFRNTRDIYISISLTMVNDALCFLMNIYVECLSSLDDTSASTIPNSKRDDPKSWFLINETPIVIAGSFLTAGVVVPEEFQFGGHELAGAGWWPALGGGVDIRYFQVYLPMSKDVDNTILQRETATAITRIEGNYCMVGGATASLSTRSRRSSSSYNNYDAVFQIGSSRSGTRGSFGNNAGTNNETRGEADRIKNPGSEDFSRTNFSIGHNTVLAVPSKDKIIFNSDRFGFSYKFKGGIDLAKDLNPYTFWSCIDTAAPVRICFDSKSLVNKQTTFKANSLWLLNTNLINARIKASTLPSAWGAAPFNQAIDMSIDVGVAVSILGASATEQYLAVTDTTKNWIPNQFVDVDAPYYIVHNSNINTGGKIVKNTKTTIWYQLSNTWAGVAFTALAVADIFRIIAPSKIVKFSSEQDYRYWALEIMPNEVGDIQSYCDGVAKIGEFGLGKSITLVDHGDVGFTETYKNITKLASQNDGYDRIEMPVGRLFKEFNIQYTNCSKEDARNMMDIFKNCKTRAIPTWFALTEHNPSDIMLCDFIDSNMSAEQVSDFDNNVYYTITLKLRQRI